MLLSKNTLLKDYRFRNFASEWQIVTAIILAGMLLGILRPQSIKAQTDTTRWTPELSMQYQSITATEISPDGNYVAYVVEKPEINKTTSEFHWHIHVTTTDGSKDIQYTHGDHFNGHPRWSPDGKKIAFLSDRDGKPQVYLIRLRGGEAYPITDAKTGVSGFQWGPEGRRIAYLMKDPKSKAEKQREREKRDVNRVNQEYRYNHLYTTQVKPADDTLRKVKRLTKGSFHVASFDWSPDGKSIVFAHQPTPRDLPYTSGVDKDISRVPADSGKVITLVDRKGVDRNPHYSPDGETIAFTSNGGSSKYYGLFDLYTLPSNGGRPRKLAHTPDRRAKIVNWSSNGKSLLVREFAGTSTHLFEIPVNGDSPQKITEGPGVRFSSSYNISADRLVFTYQNSTTPPEIYTRLRNNPERRRLTDINMNLPKPQMGKTEKINWTGPGSQKIEGLITYPVDYEKGEKVPLVLHVHGGPHAAHIRGFTGRPWGYMVQTFAQNGYAVLQPNPRGSTGYGKDFRSAVMERWGKEDYQDLMNGLDHVIEKGVAHPDSLAIMGWSYGGYMTANAVTKTDRFEAASMGAAVTNLISMTGTADIPDWIVAEMGGEIWNNYETYKELSPLYRVENVNTPTQVLHGTKDKRVPTSQGREFYRVLKRRGIATELVLYPRSGHGPSEPKLEMDVTPRIIDWFDKHLGRDQSSSASQ